MSRHEDAVRLGHMLSHAIEAVEIATGRTRDELDRDRLLNLSLVRLIEIVGEASTKVSEEFQNSNPQIPWQKIKGMRNRVIHGYDNVDFSILWDTIQIDLPPLIEKLRGALSKD